MIFAETTWTEASVAIAGIMFITVVGSVLIWQIFATGRTGLSAKREQAYQRLAEESTEAQRRIADQLEKVAAELVELRQQTTALDRVLSEVE